VLTFRSNAETGHPTRHETDVSGRHLTELIAALERRGIPAISLVGDLPIPLPGSIDAHDDVDWLDYIEFMRRLGHQVGGDEGLERCGALGAELKSTRMLRGLTGLFASPRTLYRAAIRWGLRRHYPAATARVLTIDDRHIEIRVRLRHGVRPCPEYFQFMRGAARSLPRVLGLGDAVVDAKIRPTEACYRLSLPPSRTFFARLRRIRRWAFSASSVVHFLETQALEMHARHKALLKAHAAMAEREERFRTLTNAAVDVLCEIDADGRIVYVSPSVQDLIGYAPEQVVDSHFHLWVSSGFRALADTGFEEILARSPESGSVRDAVSLHTADRGEILAEITARSHRTTDGDWRVVCTLRAASATHRATKPILSSERNAPEIQEPNRSDAGRLDLMRDALATYQDAASRGRARSNAADPERRDPHPLERSLARLIEALDARRFESSPAAATRLVEATDRMTRIVDRALLSDDDAIIDAEWIETRKLMERIRLDASIQSDIPDSRLRIRIDSEATEIWGRADLLMIGLSALLGCARAAAPVSSEIEIATNLERDAAGNAWIAIGVAAVADSENRGDSESKAQQPPAPSDGAYALSEAIAIDVANAHDGDVTIDLGEVDDADDVDDARGWSGQMRIPHPR
jgi:PAS domain S-box-containing protein